MGSYKVLYDYPNYASLPAVGDVSRLYITNDTNTLYRWVDGAYHFFTTTSVPWGNIDGVLTNQTDLMAVLNGKQPLITAGTTAQYYRGDKTFQTLNTTAVPEGTNLYWTDARFNTGFSGKTTSNLTEGTNLYYTQGRFDSAFGAKSTTNLAEGSNLYYTQGRFDSAFGAKSTSNLAEGTNLYYTDARFDTRLASKTTDNLTEGATRLYYSSGRFNADFNSKTTDNLTEGSTNLFWTPARSRNALTITNVGTGGAATYNSTTGELNIPIYEDNLINPLTGAGAEFYVPRYSGTTSLTPGLIYDNGVYVGINRTNPFYTLDVNGTLNVEGVSIYRNLAGTGERLVYVTANGTLTPAIIGSGLSMVSGTLSATGTASGSIGGSGTIGFVPKFSGTAAITNSNIQDSGSLITLGSNSEILGGLKIGVNTLSTQSIRIGKNVTGGTNISNVVSDGAVQSDVTNEVTNFISSVRTVASVFTLNTFSHFGANQISIGSGSIITNQAGYTAAANLIGATNNFGFRGLIPSGTNRWNIYMDGTANNYLAGSLGIGTTSLTGVNLAINKGITGSTSSNGVLQSGFVNSDVTATAVGIFNQLNTSASTFNLTNYIHFTSNQGIIGSGSTITNQYGFFADSNMIGATNDFGFYGNIPSGTGRWNLYMNGTADNYLAGSLGIGSNSLTARNLLISKNITGAITSYGIFQDSIIQSDVTNKAAYFSTFAGIQNTAFSIANIYHFEASSGLSGSATISNQTGFFVANTLTQGVNNFGFRGQIASAANRWNLYMDGTANNYLAGNLGIGNTSVDTVMLRISKSFTSTLSASVLLDSQASATATNVTYLQTSASTVASATLGSIRHINITQGTFGAGTTVTNQFGVQVGDLTGATTNYGFFGNISAGTGKWNLYMGGTASNYLAGALSIGVATANASALLQVDSTTQGVLFPRMTTTQKNAISSPAVGLIVYDTTLNKLCVYTGAWQTITSA
jgi:hypothetical protein